MGGTQCVSGIVRGPEATIDSVLLPSIGGLLPGLIGTGIGAGGQVIVDGIRGRK